MAAGTGATQSKYVARRETPVYIAENCTQCMECITRLSRTPRCPTPPRKSGRCSPPPPAITSPIPTARKLLLGELKEVEQPRPRPHDGRGRERREKLPFKDIIREEVTGLATVPETARDEFLAIIDKLPLAYGSVPAIFRNLEKKAPGTGGLFSIFVSDLCKGCGECVQVCGDHDALRMTVETEDLNAKLTTAQIFSRLLPDTPQKFLGLYNDGAPQSSREAALRNHLMVRRNYEALVSGDGACAGCGEKSILRACASVTEAYMRPLYHAKADRLTRQGRPRGLAKGSSDSNNSGPATPPNTNDSARRSPTFSSAWAGKMKRTPRARIEAHGPISDAAIVEAIAAVLRQDAFNHKQLQAIDGRFARGMSVMFMGASTGCNTVYGSTPPSNPHPYPWMNSLFQDGPDHRLAARRIVDHATRPPFGGARAALRRPARPTTAPAFPRPITSPGPIWTTR